MLGCLSSRNLCLDGERGIHKEHFSSRERFCKIRISRGPAIRRDTNTVNTIKPILAEEHEDWPGFEVKKSFLHLVHDDDPVFDAKVPFAQRVHCILLVFELYVPAGQLVHCSMLLFDAVPKL